MTSTPLSRLARSTQFTPHPRGCRRARDGSYGFFTFVSAANARGLREMFRRASYARGVRRPFWPTLLVLATPVVVVGAANAVVLLDARGATASSLAAVPHADAALVLGAQVLPNGHPSPMLTDR